MKNQIHAQNVEAEPNLKSLERMTLRIKFLNSQEKEIKGDIATIVKENPDLEKTIGRITSIPGVGALTAVIVLAETNGFE